ncbi:LexA family transcriptional regulator [Afifella sp. H1R]|uniref:XRE family transcriptional regulator n=1 Tax=Afifella sp. H1R TaxID=2908841 RepID=UPI001F1972A0|nr:XRE family transcriptional regulator [Afifella sp. H1R]MCF1502167.1 LexA family transcriptional regulator [Afifella sp. H1R]
MENGLKERVRQRLDDLGINPFEAARRAGVERNFINDLLSGRKRSIRDTSLTKLARGLNTSEAWLLGRLSEDDNPRRAVPLVGFVGAGGEAHLFGAGQGPFDDVPAPSGATEHTVAVEIRGDSLGSIFNGWRAYYDEVRAPVTPDLIGSLCVVGLDDDRVLVKKLASSERVGRFHLLSENAEPIFDAHVVWAAKVLDMKPR